MRNKNRTWTKRRLLIAIGVLSIPLAALAWWLGSPLFLDTTVDETFPTVGAVSPTTDTDVPAAGEPDPEPTEVSAAASPQPAENGTGPVPLLEGSFTDADSAHRGSGSATVFELEDGSRVLRLEEFEVTNGPDLHVLLVPSADTVNRDLLADVGYEDLGRLKGNIGNQNYEIPEEIDLEGPWTVVIYCDPFHVVFSTAQLSA